MLATLVPPPPLSPRRDGPGPAAALPWSAGRAGTSGAAPEPAAPWGSAVGGAGAFPPGYSRHLPGRRREGPSPAAPGPAHGGGRERCCGHWRPGCTGTALPGSTETFSPEAWDGSPAASEEARPGVPGLTRPFSLQL